MSTEYTIDRLGHLGDGIAEGSVFVPYALPGEAVTGTLSGQTLQDMKIVTPSVDRVKPPCRHFPACGGCKLQHSAPSLLQSWKEGVVRLALNAHGLEVEFLPTHSSPAQTRRRAVLSARRTKKGAMVGFYAPASDILIETPECQLLHPDLIAAFPALHELAQIGASRKHALSVMVTLSEGGVDASVTDGKALEPQMQVTLAELARRHGLARLCWDGEVIVTRRDPVQRFGTAQVTPPPGAFLQATQDGQARLQADVRSIVAGTKRIVDLFAGCGTFALDLASDHDVHAVEGDPAMIHALDQAWRKTDGLHGVSSESRDLFRRPLMPDELKSFDAAVLDPPRVGAEAQIEQICASGLQIVAYVSCNPVSFARDAAKLVQAGFALKHLRIVDQFKWSAHVELVANFQRGSG